MTKGKRQSDPQTLDTLILFIVIMIVLATALALMNKFMPAG